MWRRHFDALQLCSPPATPGSVPPGASRVAPPSPVYPPRRTLTTPRAACYSPSSSPCRPRPALSRCRRSPHRRTPGPTRKGCHHASPRPSPPLPRLRRRRRARPPRLLPPSPAPCPPLAHLCLPYSPHPRLYLHRLPSSRLSQHPPPPLPCPPPIRRAAPTRQRHRGHHSVTRLRGHQCYREVSPTVTASDRGPRGRSAPRMGYSAAARGPVSSPHVRLHIN